MTSDIRTAASDDMLVGRPVPDMFTCLINPTGIDVENGGRKARVDGNRCADVDGGKELAVFMHTFYNGRWVYDGYRAFAKLHEAVRFRDDWLFKGASA
jgi:hypothetical protein